PVAQAFRPACGRRGSPEGLRYRNLVGPSGGAMTSLLQGVHHITLCPGGAQQDIDFFTEVLGQRLIKQTVLMDGSIPIYHFYYGNADADVGSIATCFPYRSEEHTSELQSLRHLVCRLLLEKKK